MNREDYRKAFDEISFSADFQERTTRLLRARESEKETKIMTFGKTKKMALLTAAAVALLAVSVSAALLWLTPAQVADRVDRSLLAEAFNSPDAITINETVESGDFSITLLGMVSGSNLEDLNTDVDEARTYAVLGISRLDGTPLTEMTYDENGDPVDDEAFDFFDYMMTPMVAGCSPAAVNSFTLNAGANGYAEGGVYYWLLDTKSIEMFADRTVYMVFYEGGVPNNNIFTMNDDGTIAFCDDFEGVHAMFTLPLDPAKADPAAAEAFLAEYDIGWTNERAPVEENEEKPEFCRTLTPMTAEEYETYMAEELEQAWVFVEEDPIFQQSYDETAAEMERVLAGIKDGTLIAVMQSNGGVTVATAPEDGETVVILETQDGVTIKAG